MKIDKHWILWIAFFVLEFGLLRLTITPSDNNLNSPEAWRRAALLAALASTAAVILGLITWRMRWSMRPRLLRVIAVILMGVGVVVSVLEWHRVYSASKIIAEEKPSIPSTKLDARLD